MIHYGGRYSVPYVPGEKVRESYPPVQEPENSSSTRGIGNTWNNGLGAVLAMLALCLLVDAAVVVAYVWPF